MRSSRSHAHSAGAATASARIDPCETSHKATTSGSTPPVAARPPDPARCSVSDSSCTSPEAPEALYVASLQLRTITIASRNDGWPAHHARSCGRSHRAAARRIDASSRWLKALCSARSIPTPSRAAWPGDARQCCSTPIKRMSSGALGNGAETPAKSLDDGVEGRELPDLLVREDHPELTFDLGDQHQVVERGPRARRARREFRADDGGRHVEHLRHELAYPRGPGLISHGVAPPGSPAPPRSDAGPPVLSRPAIPGLARRATGATVP